MPHRFTLDLKRLAPLALTAAIIFAALFVPLMVKLRAITIPELFLGFGYGPIVLDGFAWYKSLLVGAAALLAAIALILKRGPSFKTDLLFAALAILVAASACFSPYRQLTLYGVPYLFESTFTSLAYLMLATAACRLSSRVAELYLPLAIALTALIMAPFGLAESAGVLWINDSWLASLISKTQHGHLASYQGEFAAASIPFGNPNYAGMYAAMIWPYLLGVAATRRSQLGNAFYSLAAGAAFAYLAASMTRGAYIAGSTAALLVLAFLTWHKRWHWHLALLLAGTHALAYGAHSYFATRSTSDRLASIGANFSSASFQTSAGRARRQEAAVYIDKGRLRIDSGAGGHWTLLVERQLKAVKFMDATFRPLPFQLRGNRVQLLDRRYESLVIFLRDFGLYQALSIQNIDIAVTNRGFRLARSGTFVTPIVGERFPLPLQDAAFSNRIFIWARTLPLLRKTLWLGQGAGSFPFQFPNHDPVAMSSFFGPKAIVDKPHSYYLSFAHTHGGIALLILLGLFIWYGKEALSLIFTRRAQRQAAQMLPYFAGFAGFVIAGLSNDSTIGVATSFWILLGAGLGISQRRRNFQRAVKQASLYKITPRELKV